MSEPDTSAIEQIATVESPPENTLDSVDTKKTFSIKKIFIGCLAVFGVLFILYIVLFIATNVLGLGNNSVTDVSEESRIDQVPIPSEETAETESAGITDQPSGVQGTVPDVVTEPKVLSAVNWLSPIEKVSTLPLFTAESLMMKTTVGKYSPKDAEFFKVGTISGGTVLYRVNVPFGNTNYTNISYFSQDQNGTFTLLYENDSYAYDGFSKTLLPNIKAQYTTIKALEMPETVDLQQGTLARTNAVIPKLPVTSTTEGMPDTKYGKLVQDVVQAENYDGLSNVVYYLQRKDGTYLSYELNPEIVTDDNKLKMKPKTPKEYSDSFLSGLGSACGGRGGTRIATHASDLEGAKKIGETYFGDLYQITDTSNAILKTLYKTYKSSREYEGGPKILSIEEFAKQPNHVFWRDQFGKWEVFMSDQFVPPAECGKPVIYLYPESATDVQVQVGAKITVSDPEYGNGWSGRAFPDGKIVVNGQSYPYLFWEGLGNGSYPSDISSRGTIVKRNEAESTIQAQLRAQGLNGTEIADFMEFWGDKIPNTPYVRLSWLGTREMNELAPLSITPRADTVIRVFLDMQGLESYRTITPHRFYAPARKGFTAVEWGGLLLGSYR